MTNTSWLRRRRKPFLAIFKYPVKMDALEYRSPLDPRLTGSISILQNEKPESNNCTIDKDQNSAIEQL